MSNNEIATLVIVVAIAINGPWGLIVLRRRNWTAYLAVCTQAWAIIFVSSGYMMGGPHWWALMILLAESLLAVGIAGLGLRRLDREQSVTAC